MYFIRNVTGEIGKLLGKKWKDMSEKEKIVSVISYKMNYLKRNYSLTRQLIYAL